MRVKSVSPATLKNWLDAGEATVIDVREPGEYVAEHIDGAMLVPLDTLQPSTLPDSNGLKTVMMCRVESAAGSPSLRSPERFPPISIISKAGSRAGRGKGCRSNRSEFGDDAARLMRFLKRF